ncbi:MULTISPECIES: DUF4136 domain-containing protein [Shewanella]|uniref:DUF4136 domain-containing protein n=1 Tax=Shewanella sedimentimangrovi TaxID=2814293 RepID=A0ABX7R2X9_9GAMM|nr:MULTISPECIES: DUF4136 domain-containing protein [Shewanella]QSX38189.1 DUF4136 domain-containing protein [Shewanella sedimentimangrovi]QSX42555.1 DUF4136 domain-containing protein [Shewanella cyperi]
MKKYLIALAALALGACSSIKTSWDFDPAVNFTQYKTYAWVAKQEEGAGYHLDGLMDQRVRDAVDAELKAKGFSLVATEQADLLVNYLTKVDKKINVDTFNTSFGYNPYWGPSWGFGNSVQTQTVVREYEVGTLIVDLVDHKSDRLVWRGSLADTIKDKNTPQEREALIRQAVAKIMANYPPNRAQ